MLTNIQDVLSDGESNLDTEPGPNELGKDDVKDSESEDDSDQETEMDTGQGNEDTANIQGTSLREAGNYTQFCIMLSIIMPI